MKRLLVLTFISLIATAGIAQQNAMAYFRAAQDKADNKDFAGAIDDCTECLALPDAATATIPFGFFHHSCLKVRAQAYESMKDYSKALADYTLLTESNSTEFQEESFRYYGVQAKMLAELNRYNEALAAHSKAIASLPYDFSYAERAETYRKMKDYKRAIDDYSLAIDIRKRTIDSYPESEDNYLERGLTILEAGMPKDQACADFQAAKKIWTKQMSSAGQARLMKIDELIKQACSTSSFTNEFPGEYKVISLTANEKLSLCPRGLCLDKFGDFRQVKFQRNLENGLYMILISRNIGLPEKKWAFKNYTYLGAEEGSNNKYNFSTPYIYQQEEIPKLDNKVYLWKIESKEINGSMCYRFINLSTNVALGVDYVQGPSASDGPRAGKDYVIKLVQPTNAQLEWWRID